MKKKQPKKQKQLNDKPISKDSIDYICQNCNFIKKKSFSSIMKQFFNNFLVTAGIIFICYLAFLLTLFSPTELLNLQTSILTNYEAYQYNSGLRDIGLQYVAGCYDQANAGLEDECIIRNVFIGLSGRMKYVKTPVVMDLEYIYNSSYGDCKNLASLYVAILRNLDVEAYVDSNIDYKHAVAIAVPEGKSYYYRADLAMHEPELVAFNKGDNHWSYYEK